MKLFSLLLSLLFSLSLAAQAPTAKPVYFEKAAEGFVRFYFDKNYFLVDKDCPFKSIERVSKINVATNTFEGEFKDFDYNGRVLLTGNYTAGAKDGVFRSFHANGALKWEITFKNNLAVGEAKYFYPDGKPMLRLGFTENSYRILDFWDQRTRHRVVDGNGQYEFKMPFDLYNEYGYPFFERKGKIKDGLPEGYWTTNLLDDKNKRVLFTEEQYAENGALVDAYNLFEDKDYKTPITLIPAEHFLYAENLTYKTCSFDDFSGFYQYLTDKFDQQFQGLAEKQVATQSFEYQVRLNKSGTPLNSQVTKGLLDKKANSYLESVIRTIPYYFPSMDSQGKPIEDLLTVSGSINHDHDGTFMFHSFSIQREKQP